MYRLKTAYQTQECGGRTLSLDLGSVHFQTVGERVAHDVTPSFQGALESGTHKKKFCVFLYDLFHSLKYV